MLLRAFRGTQRVFTLQHVNKTYFRHEYPWLCSLRKGARHICGVTVISIYPKPTIIVGAAHCVNPNSKQRRMRPNTYVTYQKYRFTEQFYPFLFTDPTRYYKIVCGEHDLREDERAKIILDVTSIVRHPRYVSAPQVDFILSEQLSFGH